MQGRLNLRERLLVVMGCALVPLFGLAMWDAVRDIRVEAQLATSQLRNAASLLAANQERVIQGAEQLLGAIASVPDLASAERTHCQPYLQALRARYPLYTNIALFDTHGDPLCHALGESGPQVRDRDYFRLAISGKRFVIGEAVIGRVSGKPSVPFAMPVIEGEKVVAVVLAGLDLEKASQTLEAVELPQGSRVVVADRRGRVIMQTPNGGAFLRPVDAPLAAATAGKLRASDGEARDASGEIRLFAIAPTRTAVEDEGFVVRVDRSRDEATRRSWEQGVEEAVALALVLVAAMGVVWWIGGEMIVKPATQILGTARQVQLGRVDARVPVNAMGQQRGEFGRLGAAFNLMADSLQMRQVDLETELARNRHAYSVLDLVLNSMQEGLIAVTADGKFLLHNAAAARMFPLADAPVLPELWPQHFGIHHTHDRSLYRAEDLPLVRSALGESEGEALVLVINPLVPEGRLVQCTWHRMEGESVRGGLVVFSDVTELQRLEAERSAQLARLEDTQRKLVESQRIGRVGNWELDLRTGKLWWSDEVFSLFGVTRDAFGNDLHAFEQLVHPEDRPLLKPVRDQALRDARVMNIEYRVVRPDGSTAWMHEIAEARRDDTGEPVWFGGVVQDVTERKAAALENARLLREVRELNAGLETRIAERTAQLEATNRELEAFSYSVSHDLRAPLAAVAGFSRALHEKLHGSTDEKTLHFLGRIQVGVHKMEQLIEALLELSRVTQAPLVRKDADLTAIARDTAESLQQQDPAREVEVRVQEGLVAHGDARLLRVVIENLVGNAWKFTAGVPDARIDVGRNERGEFYVRDNGVGFDMAYAGKLFTAFHRLHKETEFPGTGIGLATVSRVLGRHHGRVWAESQPGAGTTFYFTL
jgi:PAS domain S-box-containing protein